MRIFLSQLITIFSFQPHSIHIQSTVHFFLVRHYRFSFLLSTLVRVLLLSLHRMPILLIHRVIKMLLILVTSYYPAQRHAAEAAANENAQTILPWNSRFFFVHPSFFSPVISKLAYAVSVDRITKSELWEYQALWGYATTEINVYELIKISSMTSYNNFAIHTHCVHIVWLFGVCVVRVNRMCWTWVQWIVKSWGWDDVFIYFFFQFSSATWSKVL